MKLNKIIAGVLAFAITIVFLPKINFENNIEAYDSTDDFNLHTYMADNILCDGTIANRRLGFYLNDAKPMAEIWLDSVTPTFKSAVSAWENVNLALSPDDIPSKAIEAKGYYMTVILSMIQASYEGDHVVDKLVNADIKEASTLYNGFAKLFKEMSNADIDSYLSKGSFTDDEVALLNAVQKKFLEDNKFLSAGKTASDIIDMVNLAKKPTEYVDKFIQYCNVYEISNEWKECLQEMYNKSPKDGSPLCQALETLIYASQDINNSVYQIWADGFEEITNEFYKFAVKELTKAITDCCPLVKGMKIGQTIGKSISNLLFSTDKTIEEYYVITAYCQVADLFKSVFDDKINQYKNNKTTYNAQKFLTYLDMYFQVFITGNEFGQDFTDVMYTGGIVTHIARSRDEYENFIEFTKDSTKTAIAAHEHITTSWLDYLYNDNLEMYEVLAAALGDLANTYISVTRVEFEKETVEWGIQDFDHTGYKCTVYPENATNKDLIYTSSDSSVAEITNEGVLRLNSTGTCVITARAVDNNETIYDTLSVTVIQEGGADSRKQTIFPFTEEVPKPSEEVPKPSNGDFSYSLTNDGTIRITGYTGNETSITIPNDIDGYKVTEIGTYAFKYSSLTSIIIPKTLTSASYGSLGSSSITSVVFEEGIENIPAYICSRATALESVSIPDSVTSIGNCAFTNCESLTSVELPASVTSISDYAFEDCICLESITLGGIQSIGYMVFDGCKSLTSLIIPKTLTSFDYHSSFYGPLGGSSIKSVVFEEGIENIPADICKGATALTSVTIPDSVTSIDDSAFRNCEKLSSIKIGSSVKKIGSGAFSDCESLTSVELPTSVTSIGNYVFQNCVCLESITLGGVQSMGYAVFNGCKSLTNLIIPKTLTSAARNSSFYGSLGSSCITSVVFEEGIKNIPVDICSRAKLLSSVTIPDSVTSIDDSAFFECESLTSVELPASVTNIGGYAFRDCEKLSSIKIGSSVKKIGSGAFSGCESLTSVELPTSVTSISDYAFEDCICLESITLGGIQSMGCRVFNGCKSLTSLIIPKTLTSADYYLSYGPLGGSSITSVVFEEGIKNIPDYICIGATALESVTIPDSVTSIGNCAFINCESLTSVELPASVTSINDYAFEDCICLKSITLGGVQSMGCKVFNGCKSLTSLIIPKTLTNPSSKYYSLTGSSITSVVFEEGIKNIPAYICGGATALVSVTIPDSVTSIDDSAFFHCKNLTSVELPISVTSIGDTAFNGCESLTSVELPASVTSIGWSAFAGCNSLLTFYGIDGSYAQKYANTYSIKFVAMDNKALFDIETKIIVTGHDLENITLIVTKDEASSTPDSVYYNITLTDGNGSEVQPAGNVTVKIPVPNGWDGIKCKVYRKEPNGIYTDMNAKYEDNYMVFVTDHFSEYIITNEILSSNVTSGDVNTDSKVNDQDSILLDRHLAEWDNTIDTSAADMNGDGKINDQDSIILARTLAGWYD